MQNYNNDVDDKFMKVLHKFIIEFSTINLLINLEIEWNGRIYTIKEDMNDP